MIRTNTINSLTTYELSQIQALREHHDLLHRDALPHLTKDACEQRMIGDKIVSLIDDEFYTIKFHSIFTSYDPFPELIQKINSFNPSLIPSVVNPYWYLETAIKIGNPECVKKLFARYESTRSDYKEEMRSSEWMQVPYRPIYWLAAVCDSQKIPSKPSPYSYIKIMEFMEEKLGIPSNHQHNIPYGLISKIDYINAFCKDTPKKEAILRHLSHDVKNSTLSG